MSRNQRADAGGPRKFTNIFVKNFGDQLDEDKLRELLSKHGKITSFKVKLIQTKTYLDLFSCII
jgi:polyadenylate-binding protein